MHEVGLLENMIDQLARQLSAEQLQQLSAVHLLIGCRSGVDVNAMQFAFDATRGNHVHLGSAVELHIEIQQAQLTCTQCNHSWKTNDRLPTCPMCSSMHCRAEGGADLMITHVEIE